MTLFVWPPQSINISGVATEEKQDDTITILDTIAEYVDTVETLISSTNTRLNTMGTAFFTKPFDEIVPSTDATHDYFTTKLATVSQQVLTVTYSDSTKTNVTSYKVV